MGAIYLSTFLEGERVEVADVLFFPAGSFGRGTARVSYDPEWMQRGYEIEPGLSFRSRVHEVQGMPGALLDASPDDWGQRLLRRDRGRSGSWDAEAYLMGASDVTRQGALRVSTEPGGELVSPGQKIPRQIALPDLLAAADDVAAGDAEAADRAISRLVDAGSSALGGARPKVGVTGEDGALWLAKFPEPRAVSSPALEATCLDIASRAGLDVPEHRVVLVGGRPVLLVRRFDREAGDPDARIPYISARTLMNVDAGSTGDYVRIAQRVRAYSRRPEVDLPALFGQAALNVLVNNTDNHLRNLGFLQWHGGWSTSPLFDVEPNADSGAPFTGTSFGGAMQRMTAVTALLRTAREFDLTASEAEDVFERLWVARDGWDAIAAAHGAHERDIDRLREVLDNPPGHPRGRVLT